MKHLNLLAMVGAILLAAPASALTIDTITVGNPGNAADNTGHGAVAYTYRISKFEITNSQYAEFLNAVAQVDTYGLWAPHMSASPHGGISKSAGTYTAIAGRENKPVSYVSFWDALRFANWLHNGQPTGLQDNSTTEDGAYTITLSGTSLNNITRNAGARVVIPSQDEWYKAAYYNPVSANYFDYPTGTDTQTVCAAPGPTANTANCGTIVGVATSVGSYTNSESPYGTFDQGGNVYEWVDTLADPSRLHLGGSFNEGSLWSLVESGNGPTSESEVVGFRIANVPEPGTGLLVATVLLGLAAAQRRITA